MSCQLSVVSCQLSFDGRSNAIENRRTTDHGQRTIRTGVTLIELLIVILIISILAALVLGVAAVAGETAREAQTRHTVERMHTLFVDHYNTYKTRRVKLRSQITDAINNLDQNSYRPSQKGQLLAQARLMALREMMMMEVPDRWSDVLLYDVGTPDVEVPDTSAPLPMAKARVPFYLENRTDLANVYLRRYGSLVDRINTVTGAKNTAGDIKTNQAAECLYLVITLACGDGEARTLFAESSIGDTDGDGAPEILDGWGHPVSFLRWAPGFDSQIQLNANLLPSNTEWVAAAAKDPDPFDKFRVDRNKSDLPAFRLVPLIFSAGRDEKIYSSYSSGEFETYGLRLVESHVVLQGPKKSSDPPPSDLKQWPAISPYDLVKDPADGKSVFLGTDTDEGTATDNVHNHLMGQR